MSKNILIIAAHPDDEVLGCGGSILKHKANGDQIFCLWMTNGIDSRNSINKEDKTIRNEGHKKAIEFISPSYFEAYDFPDNQLDKVSLLELTKAIEKFLKIVKPDIIYTHFSHDLNIDHELTCRAVMTATRPGSSTFVKEIYSFEIPSSTEWSINPLQFIPDTYMDISNYIEEKKQYLNCYEEEMRSYPHTRSIENIISLNQLRGGHVNVNFAESFITLRRLID